MTESKIDIKHTTAVPITMRLLGGIQMLWLFTPSFSKFVSIPMAIAGLALLTSRNGLLLNLGKKTYQEYLWMLGLRFGNTTSFPRIEYLFLKSNKVTQNMSARVASTTVHSEVYDGFIRFSESEKIRVFRGKTKDAVMNQLKELSTKLGVDILDYSND